MAESLSASVQQAVASVIARWAEQIDNDPQLGSLRLEVILDREGVEGIRRLQLEPVYTYKRPKA